MCGSYKGISLLVIKNLPIGWVDERIKVHNEGKKNESYKRLPYTDM